MAVKKKSVPHTAPVFDNSALEDNPDLQKSNIIYELPEHQFSNVIRAVLTRPIESVGAIGRAARAKLTALGVEADVVPPILNTPAGSDQFDPRSILDWIDKIPETANEAVEQLQTIDATFKFRQLAIAEAAQKAKEDVPVVSAVGE